VFDIEMVIQVSSLYKFPKPRCVTEVG